MAVAVEGDGGADVGAVEQAAGDGMGRVRFVEVGLAGVAPGIDVGDRGADGADREGLAQREAAGEDTGETERRQAGEGRRRR